jgi:hypothetical protein
MYKGLAHGTILQGHDDLVVGRVGELGAALGEGTYVITETLALLFPVMAKLAGIAVSGVGALEVPYEGVLELCPALDPPLGEVLEPGTSRFGKVQQDALDDEQIVGRPVVVVGKVVVLEPNTQVGFIVLRGAAARMLVPKAHGPRGSGVGLQLWSSLLL